LIYVKYYSFPKHYALAPDYRRMHHHDMKEFVFYIAGAIISLFILGYAVHMMIGGLVSQRTEITAIVGVTITGIITIGFMAWDVMRRRR